ncbi:MAG: PilZ domain-containing protein [Planctomycetes bacterium]|jgi:c-di-GMP-binding flagellar brake protein YcgR|nr:PilZ domain-containing protein [Planctomycetota bacterium]
MDQRPQDRRENPRIVSLNLVTARPRDDAGSMESMGRTRNVSIGGILLEVKKSYPLSSTLELQIALGDAIIRPVGRVVRLQELEDNQIEMGIKFTEISERDRETLKAHITNL